MNDALHQHWAVNMRSQRKIRDKGDPDLRGSGIEAMAQALDVSPETVSRWETGKVIPRDGMKIEIARYLGIDPRTLFPLMEVPS